ncbi:MAG: type II glyceraldehyde-3-phosphate dehydrogenase [Desulfurococcales archaeon]|nr:type II glyceraldehyde-3-phosphate dehydrogenase [Desulfurococcales archaeon]
MTLRVGINGYGTIGRRVAHAVNLQDDMELLGIVKTTPDYAALQAVKAGLKLYVPSEKEEKKFREAGIEVHGFLEDLLDKIDVIVDATPGGVGAKYKSLYEAKGVKAIYQGGEKADVAELSFSTLCNYEEALGKNSLRVVSCNTTGLLRLICTLHKAFGVESVRAVIVRRAADPKEIKRGPVNAIVLNPPRLPSHHGEDVKTVLPWLDIITAAVVVPTTVMHLHSVTLKLSKPVATEDIKQVLEEAPRIILVNSEVTKIKSTAELIEAAREVRRRADIPELVIFEDSITVRGNEVILFQAVHQESIVVPENIDAIRAVARLASSAEETIKLTDSTLGIDKSLW